MWRLEKYQFKTISSLPLVGASQPVAVLFMQGSIGISLLGPDILLCSIIFVVKHDLLVHEVLEVLLGQRVLLEVEVKGGHRLRRRLIVRVVQLLQVRVLEGLLNSDTVIGVVGEHLLQQIDGVGVSALEQLVEVFALALGQLSDEVLVLLVLNLAHQFSRRVAQQFRDHVQLVLLRACRKERLPEDKLSKDAAD